MKGYYKIPQRMVYVQTIKDWIKETIYCHVVLKIWPPNLPDLSINLLNKVTLPEFPKNKESYEWSTNEKDVND